MNHNIQPEDIGYLCLHGHFCFDADPEEGGQCGSKSLGRIVFMPAGDDDLSDEDAPLVAKALIEARDHLGQQIETWRAVE